MPFPNEHAARIKDPKQFDRIRREEEGDKSFGDVDVIWGVKDDKAEVQAFRFSIKKFTEAEAKAWLKDNVFKAILFEPATGKNENIGLEICALRFMKEDFDTIQAKNWTSINMFETRNFQEDSEAIIFLQKDVKLEECEIHELRENVYVYMKESTVTGDIATTADNLGLMKRYQCDTEHNGLPCFTVDDNAFTSLSLARMKGSRYNITDERIRNFVKLTNYSKPYVIQNNGSFVTMDKTNTFRR